MNIIRKKNLVPKLSQKESSRKQHHQGLQSSAFELISLA
jgi:hypothetical protein